MNDSLTTDLIDLGTDPSVARHLVWWRREAVERQVAWWSSHGGFQNRCAGLRRAIEEDWPAPPTSKRR